MQELTYVYILVVNIPICYLNNIIQSIFKVVYVGKSWLQVRQGH